MNRTVRHLYNILRTLLVTTLVTIVAVFALSYLLLSLPAVQNKIRLKAESALSEYLHTNVSIGRVTIQPFDRLTLENVAIPDQNGDSLITVEKLGAGISLPQLVTDQRVVVTYAEIIGLNGHITRPDKQSPTNAQFLIDAFKPKDDSGPKPFDVQVFNVVIRKTNLRYDVLNEPETPDRFNPNHVGLLNLRADLALPRLKNNDFDIQLKRLSFAERSGFVLKNLAANVIVNDNDLNVNDLEIALPNSQINPDNIALHYTCLDSLATELPRMSHEFNLTHARITPADLRAFVPELKAFDEPLDLTVSATGNTAHLDLRALSVNNPSRSLAIATAGQINHLDDPARISFDIPAVSVKADKNAIQQITTAFKVPESTRHMLARCGNVDLKSSITGDRNDLNLNGRLATSLGTVDLSGVLSKQNNTTNTYKGTISSTGFQLGNLLDKTPLLGEVALDTHIDATVNGKNINATVDGAISHIDLNGNRYHDIRTDIDLKGRDLTGELTINDPAGRIRLNGDAHLNGPASKFNISLAANDVSLQRLGAKGQWAGYDLSLQADADISGNSLSNAVGNINLSDIRLDNGKKSLVINQININSDADHRKLLQIDSEPLSGTLTGTFNPTTLPATAKRIAADLLPELVTDAPAPTGNPNDLDFHLTLNPSEQWDALANLPVKLLHTATINGTIHESTGQLALDIDAPYLLQGRKNIIERTRLNAARDSIGDDLTLQASTIWPNKKGKIHINLDSHAQNNLVGANLGWRVDRERDFHGDLNLKASFNRTPAGTLAVHADINPTELVFNDTAWVVQQGTIDYSDGAVSVYNLAGQCDKQFVRINGRASNDPEDQLCLDLNDVSLDYVFETLNISNVDFGGRATGKFYAGELFTKTPRIFTPNLHVDGLSYNDAVMGDADIESSWINDRKAVSLKADVAQSNGGHALIDGGIFIADDSLYLVFDADRTNIAFMKPFMAAFTSDVQGQVSGHAVLFGKFSTINLEGDVLADSLLFKLDYTNVYYTAAGDSVHIVPDYIRFSNVTIHDRDNHQARLDGWLKHDSFHDPVFNFSITDARDLLCYDTSERDNPVWYGTIYGNGSAFVTGEPGVVDIKVNMETAPRSRFTFVLSDSEQASEFDFITFHDRDEKNITIDNTTADTIPLSVRELQSQVQQQQESRPTHYNIDLQGDITPDAQLFLVMDPVGGDQIRATGSGNMRMTYNDAGELTMFGKYTLEKGNYNFTLQDIIHKDFTIKDGSSISFQGNPYAANLDIEAVYSLNANLRDLDESFASDKEINRTNVPVHALLRAKGPMNQPDISFDIEFPTLTSDAYHKVRSIINTDDQMNRQIIYLLALNRFYTPDYMNSTARNNEWTSVASSTISSQLSSMLGKMSENWTITPNFRSDRGDFSDMEVDLALSSQLLNNRLLLNGNFGYRDNTYNTRNSNFIGDFDIEYLLNSRGNIRLKAYNHFNDQNYYVRNALTTQGVGIVWKHEFDNPFHRYRPNNKQQADSAATDTIVPKKP